MTKTITICAYRRPDYLKQVLTSLEEALVLCPEFQPQAVVIGIDPSNEKTKCEVVEVVDSFHLPNLRIIVWPEHLGVSEHPRRLLQSVFMEIESDFNFHLEDDTVLSPDAIRLVEWFLTECPLWPTDCLSLYPDSPRNTARRDHLITRTGFGVWGWGCSYNVWRKHLALTWNHRRVPPLGWDASFEETMKHREIYTVAPVLARVRNIGRELGTYQTPEGWDRDFEGVRWATESDVTRIDEFKLI